MSIAGLSDTALAADAPLVVRDDFENGAGRWQPMDPQSWKILSTPRGNVYSLFKNSDYKPPYRSPVNIALLKDVVVGDFVLEVDLQSTVKDYDHRSMVLVFGYQDPAHFYYVHFGKKTDSHANQVFIVNGDARTKISTETTPGTAWDDEWHKVKIDRDVSNGDTEIFFDNMKRPVMEAVDDTFTWGQIGIGAFDDLGNFDNLTLRGKPVKASTR
jgi:hypothetical protein